MSKEEILEHKTSFFYLEDFVYHEQDVKDAMDKWADIKSKIDAIGFAEFIATTTVGKHIKNREIIWHYEDETGRYNYATDYMYTLYKEQLKNKL